MIMNEIKKYSVLIVDDESSNIIALTHILASEYEVLAAINGECAIELAEEFTPDIILLDILMSEMDGFEVLAALRNSSITRNIPIIFITGLSETEDEEKGLALGAADYIVKPFSDTIVKLRIRNQIKMIDQTRQLAEKERIIIEQESAVKSNISKTEYIVRLGLDVLDHMTSITSLTSTFRTTDQRIETLERIDELEAETRHLQKLLREMLEMFGNADTEKRMEGLAWKPLAKK